MAIRCARRAADSAAEPMRGTAKTYEEIARAFGVTVDAVNKWKQAGRRSCRRKPNKPGRHQKWREGRKTKRGGISIQTRNHYAKAIKEFTKLVDGRRTDRGRSPCPPVLCQPEHRPPARPPSVVRWEFARLIQAAMNGPTMETVTGEDRAMLYISGCMDRIPPQGAGIPHPPIFRPGRPGALRYHSCLYSKNKRTRHDPATPHRG